MNPKLFALREIAKLAAYGFVTLGLAGTTIAQGKVAIAAAKAATVKAS